MTDSVIKTDDPEMEGTAIIRLNRPRVKNALGPHDLRALAAELSACQNDPAVTVIFITGTGDAFCSGADINFLNALSGAALASYIEQWTDLLLRIIMCPKLAIAAVNGASAGAGNHTVICCDLCIASTAASFNFTGTAKGVASMELGSFLMPMTIGLKHAKWIFLRGGRVSAEEAVNYGFCNYAVPPDEWDSALEKLAHDFAGNSTAAMTHSKYALNQGAYQMLGALKLSTIAGAAALLGATTIPTGRLKPAGHDR